MENENKNDIDEFDNKEEQKKKKMGKFKKIMISFLSSIGVLGVLVSGHNIATDVKTLDDLNNRMKEKDINPTTEKLIINDLGITKEQKSHVEEVLEFVEKNKNIKRKEIISKLEETTKLYLDVLKGKIGNVISKEANQITVTPSFYDENGKYIDTTIKTGNKTYNSSNIDQSILENIEVIGNTQRVTTDPSIYSNEELVNLLKEVSGKLERCTMSEYGESYGTLLDLNFEEMYKRVVSKNEIVDKTYHAGRILNADYRGKIAEDVNDIIEDERS